MMINIKFTLLANFLPGTMRLLLLVIRYRIQDRDRFALLNATKEIKLKFYFNLYHDIYPV